MVLLPTEPGMPLSARGGTAQGMGWHQRWENVAASARQLNLAIPGHVGLGAVSVNRSTIARAAVVVQGTQRSVGTPAAG